MDQVEPDSGDFDEHKVLLGFNSLEEAKQGYLSNYESGWKGMGGMRDRIIHGYDNVDLQIVWDVVKRDIPQIKPNIELILKEYGG